MRGKPVSMPELAGPIMDDFIRIAEAGTGCRRRKNAQARTGCAGTDVICLDYDRLSTGACKPDRRDDAGNTRPDDGGIRRWGKRAGNVVVVSFPPAGEGVCQGLSFGV